MKTPIAAILCLCAVTALAQPDDRYRGEDLQLQCYGQAEKTTVQNRSGYQWDDQQHKFVPKTGWETGKSDLEVAIAVSIHDDGGRIHIPKALIPPISGGNTGNDWWTIDDLIVGHNEIRGQFKLNALNRPRLSIDRRSGVLTIDGLIKFTGRCEPDDGHRKF